MNSSDKVKESTSTLSSVGEAEQFAITNKPLKATFFLFAVLPLMILAIRFPDYNANFSAQGPDGGITRNMLLIVPLGVAIPLGIILFFINLTLKAKTRFWPAKKEALYLIFCSCISVVLSVVTIRLMIRYENSIPTRGLLLPLGEYGMIFIGVILLILGCMMPFVPRRFLFWLRLKEKNTKAIWKKFQLPISIIFALNGFAIILFIIFGPHIPIFPGAGVIGGVLFVVLVLFTPVAVIVQHNITFNIVSAGKHDVDQQGKI